jgi:hypothetical protein
MSIATAVNVETRVDSLFEYMAMEEYEVGAPSPETEALDRAIFENGPCQRCGCSGVRFYPFVRWNPYSYRPWVVCTQCGHEREV